MDSTFVDKYTTQSLAGADSLGMLDAIPAAVASTITDIGTSLWNSAVVGIPKLIGADTSEYSASTFDLLDSVNSDWSNFYRQNEGAVQTASFVGGSLLIGGIALKGMQLLQAGKIGMYPALLKDASQVARISRLTASLEAGAGASAEFQAARWAILGVDAAQQVAQAAGMEVALLATFNEHPFYEDYFKDPVKNFGISVVMGGVIGAGIGQITIRKTLRDSLGAAESAAVKATTDKLINIPFGLTDVSRAQFLYANAKQLADLSVDETVNPLTREIAAFAKQRFEGEAARLENLIAPDIMKARDIPQGVKDSVRALIQDDSSFGANRISLMTFAEDAKTRTKFPSVFRSSGKAFEELKANSPELFKLGALQRQGLVASSELQKVLPDWKALMESEFSIYFSPHFGAYIPHESGVAQQYARAVDIGTDVKKLAVNVLKPKEDSIAALGEFMIREKPTSIADRVWVGSLKSASSAQVVGNRVVMHSNDLPTINAWISRGLADQAAGVEKPLQFFLTTGEKDAGRLTSIDDLVSHLAVKKEEMARKLLNAGASMQEMSIRLNTDVDSLTKFFLNSTPLRDSAGWRQYTLADAIESVYLSKEGQMLKLTTNGQHVASLRYRNTDMSIKLDQKYLAQADRDTMLQTIRAVGSPQIEEQFLSLHSNNELFDTLRAKVSDVVNNKMGTGLLSSHDFATRDMQEISDIAAYIGKVEIGRNNTQAKALLTNLSAAIHAHTQTQAGLNEINAVFNHLAGMSGYRNFEVETGRLYTHTFDEAGKEIRNYIATSDIAGVLGSELSAGAKNILSEMRTVSEQMYKIANTVNRIQGFRDLDNIGLNVPTFNPNNKFISYIIDTTSTDPSKTVRLLIGKSPEELASLERRFLAENTKPGVDLVTKSQQETYNAIRMRLDPVKMDFVDVNKFHSGASAAYFTPTNDLLTSTLIENLHGRMLHYSKKIQEMYLHETMDTLDLMSALNTKMTAAQPIAAKFVGTFQPRDAARTIKNMILGNSQLDQHTTWQTFNNSFSSLVDYVSNKVSKVWHSFDQTVDTSKPLAAKDWVKYSKELEGMGVVDPFKNYDEYLLFKGDTAAKFSPIKIVEGASYAQNIEKLKVDTVMRLHSLDRASAEQLIATGNSVLSTLALRVMETGQPFVNAISMPILGIPELMRNLPKTYLGNEITREGVGVGFPARVIYDGIRFRHSEAAKPFIEKWIADGLGQSIVSEATQIKQLTYKEGRGITGKINSFLTKEGGIVEKLSKPSDLMEGETRLWALSIGFQAARTAYPGISDVGANLFAARFLDRVIGNYHASQRPALFQGTAGVALGLFQTYMISWGQSMYRSIEEGAGKVLAAQMLIQAGLFGTSSLPGYDLFSKTIASHFSDKHYDLTTGTYRALPNALAEFVTYGLPASMGVGLYTRGDLQPRIPLASQNNPLDQLASINVIRQFYGATAHAMTKTLEAQGMSAKARALLEGLSMQSLSRPVARIAEIVPLPDGSGGVSAVGSLSREGNTVATSSEVWSLPGLYSRILASRSTEEQVKREMDYMSSFHATLDTQNRKSTTESLKTAIRSGTLSEPGVMEHISKEYLRTGTATGWQAAMNEALATSSGGIDYKLEKRLKPDDPLQQMIKSNF